VCALETTVASSFKYHDLHISVSISSCSWYEFRTEVLKHFLENVQVHNFNEYLYELNIRIKNEHADIETQN
jgi:hypothetical protein